MLLDTNQSAPRNQLTLQSILKQRDQKKTIDIYERNRAAELLSATKEKIAQSRSNECVNVELSAVNKEFMRWLSTHPDAIKTLPPRKFEEVVAAILKDQGHEVEITPQTRDGGYDIIAVMKTQLGNILTIVECKRTGNPYSVGIGVIERFLYTLREKKRANLGIIATTTHFSPEAKKCAKDYDYLLKLADFETINGMSSQYGKWHKSDDSNIWVPQYTVIKP